MSEAPILVCHPGSELYGSDRMLVETVAALVAAGREVVVTVPSDGQLVALLKQAGAAVEFCETLVVSKALLSPKAWPQLIVNTVRGLLHGVRLLRRLRPQVVLANTITVPLWLPLSRVFRTHTVLHVHEAENSASRFVKRLLYAPAHAAQRVVVNSHYALGVLNQAAPGVAERARVVYNTVSGPENTTLPREDAPSAPKLLFIGRLSQRKGPHIAISALRLLRDRGIEASLDLLGEAFEGNEPFAEELQNQVHALGLDSQVRFLGFVTDIWPVVEAADIVCIPSTVDESFGNTAVEATLAARPLVASDIAGLKEARTKGRSTRGVPPNDPMAIADAVESLLNQWDAVCQSVALDQAQAREQHSSQTYAKAITAVVRFP